MLDIQDKNIYISDNAVTYGQHKGKDCKFIKAKLTYEVNECPDYKAELVGTLEQHASLECDELIHFQRHLT